MGSYRGPVRPVTTGWQAIDVLVTVKAYPQMSSRGETVCVAGIRRGPNPGWLRLYPMDFRDRSAAERFKKYDVVRVLARPHGTDTRPETMRPRLDVAIEVVEHLDTSRGWASRREDIEPVFVGSMCEIEQKQRQDRTSLGAFRPREVQDLVIEAANRRELKPRQALAAAQGNLLIPEEEGKPTLVHVPYTFRYLYRCEEEGCSGHDQMIIDWEIGAAWRSWSRGCSEAEMKDKIRAKWLEQMWAPDRDSALFVGNLAQRQHIFVVCGVFWPPVQQQMKLL